MKVSDCIGNFGTSIHISDSIFKNTFVADKMAEAFQLPENEDILTCLALGYPAEGTGPLANHNSRKPIEETVTYL